MADVARSPQWSTFRELVEAGDPAILPVDGDPHVLLFVGPNGASIGMRIPADPSMPPEPSPLEDVDVVLVTVDGEPVTVISTSRPRLFEETAAVMDDCAAEYQAAAPGATIDRLDVAPFRALGADWSDELRSSVESAMQVAAQGGR